MKMKNINSKIFLVALLLLSGVILIKLVLNTNEYNFVDNRMSYKFSMPDIENLLSGEYQKATEEAIADQMPKYNYFKLSYLKIVNYLSISTINVFKLDKPNRYINIDGINLYKNYLLYYKTTDEQFIKTAQKDISEINNIYSNTNANIYLYFIETDTNINFEDNSKLNALSYLKENINIPKENITSFEINSFDDYKKNFYKTDHHWNHVGSYKGYTEIAKMMHFNNILEPKDEVCFDTIRAYGSKAKRIANIKIANDTMCQYTFDYPEFETYIDGKPHNYGHGNEELNEKNNITYSDIYGADYAEVVFKNNGINNNKKILVYANSYSNAINKLIAANYKETYVIDGRYYNKKSMIDYINEKEIDDVLIIANCMLFNDSINW